MRKAIKPAKFIAKLATFKPLGVDLGALQTNLAASTKGLRSAETKLTNAQDAFDGAKARHQSDVEKLRAASRAVLAG